MTREEFITKYPEGEQLLKDFNFPPEEVIVTEIDTERFYSLIGFLLGRVEDLSHTSCLRSSVWWYWQRTDLKGEW